jgi:chromatin remodeling complex protein RSC6
MVVPPLTRKEEGMANTKAKKSTKAPKRVPFGGYEVCFKGRTDTLESLFGNAPMPPSAMTKRLWEYVKRHHLATKG